MAIHVLAGNAFAALGLALAPPQEIQTLVLEGQGLGGLQTVGAVIDFSVNAQGSWLVRATNQSAFGQELLIRDGLVVMTDSTFLPSVPDLVDGMQSAALDPAGDFALGLDLTFAKSCLYYKGAASLFAGSAVPGLPSGTTWTSFGPLRWSGGLPVLVRGAVDIPFLPGVDEAALVLMTLDPLSGAVLSQTPVAVEGLPLPFGTVVDIGGFAVNASGQTIFTASTPFGSGVFADGAPLVLDNDPAPVPGFLWKSLLFAAVDRNDAGDTVVLGDLAPEGRALAKNGELFAKAGGALPSILPYVLTQLGISVCLSNRGDVLWEGSWDHPDPKQDSGLFQNGLLLVQEGKSAVEGVQLELSPVNRGFVASDDGRFVVFWAQLAGGKEGAFLLDLGSVDPVPGCSGNPGLLAHAAGLPVPGGSLELALDGGQASGVVPFVAFSDAPAAGAPGCGIEVAGFGELLLELAPPHLFFTASAAPWTGAAVPLEIQVPPNPALAGFELFAQGAFVDLAGATPAEPVRATNGLRIVLGQ